MFDRSVMKNEVGSKKYEVRNTGSKLIARSNHQPLLTSYLLHLTSYILPPTSCNYLTKAVATPPSTLITFPVDLFSKPPVTAKHALAMSSGNMISLSKVRLA